MNQDKIEKLLKSNCPKDQVIGVHIALSHLGSEWCKENFTIADSPGRAFKYPSNTSILVECEEFVIYLGADYIEYWEEGMEDLHPNVRNEIIETIKYDTNNELSKSI